VARENQDKRCRSEFERKKMSQALTRENLGKLVPYNENLKNSQTVDLEKEKQFQQ